MTIDLCFQGWLRGAGVTHVWDTSNSDHVGIRKLIVTDSKSSPGKVDLCDGCLTVKTITREEFVTQLNDGRLTVSLAEMLQGGHKHEIKIHDFAISD